jgi:hypothetical protein
MPFRCKGMCDRLESVGKRYNDGIKKCTVCDEFIKTRTLNCMCCGARLKLRPKRLVGKENILKKQGFVIKRIE